MNRSFFNFFRADTKKSLASESAKLQVGSRSVPLVFMHHPRARRYLLRLQPDGVARVTIPRRGSVSAARDFAFRNIGWLEQQFQRLATQPQMAVNWNPGTEIYFRGELISLQLVGADEIHFGSERIKIFNSSANLRTIIQKYLHRLAQNELPQRVWELAALYGVEISRVSIRNQKSRWGSCSRRGTISLNWRLIQTPDFVRDYIILHELAHRRQMNHSAKFWQEVERLCPDYLTAERWLKQHTSLLR